MNLSIEFVARGRAGKVDVSVARNGDPSGVGCDAAAEGFPICHAVVTHVAEGYDALLGWVQLVGTGSPRSYEIDPLQIYEGLDTPFGFYGIRPTLFDAPYRRDRTQYLDWLAHSFLCVAPSQPMAREAVPVLGFSWGFVLDNGDISIVEPQLLNDQDWAEHVGFLRTRFPSWSFGQSLL